MSGRGTLKNFERLSCREPDKAATGAVRMDNGGNGSEGESQADRKDLPKIIKDYLEEPDW